MHTQARRLLLISTVVGAIAIFVPPVAGITPQGWRLLVIFLGTIVGLTAVPEAGGGVVLLALTATVVGGVLSLSEALSGYSSSPVWLVVAAFFIARAAIKTGLARRIALLFIRRFGHTSRGLAYSLVASDIVLATVIPSTAARAGGIILPITRSIAELFKSHPGETSALLGSYLMTIIFQGDIIACAMFLTGQAGNPLAADLAHRGTGLTLDWGLWLTAALAPGLVSLVLIPLLLARLDGPQITSTPAAADFARRELAAMGPFSRAEMSLAGLVLAVCGLWATSSYHGLGTATVAFVGVSGLFLTDVLTWADALDEKRAWDIFIWYGGLVCLGGALNQKGVTQILSERLGGVFLGWGWFPVFVALLLICFVTHYAFASITAQIAAMYAVFLALMVSTGVPPALGALALAFFANLGGGLTHYGTTPALMIFSTGYVPLARWWKLGLLCGLLNVAIWLVVGLGWWKLLGLW